MRKESKIAVLGASGLVGGAIMRKLVEKGYSNIIGTYKSKRHAVEGVELVQVDLTNQSDTERFFKLYRPDYVFLAAARVGGILANSTYKADFIYDNLAIAVNVIHSAFRYGVKKLLNLGSRYGLFPFPAQVLTPRDVLQVDFDDPSFTSLCIASVNRFPQVKVSAKKEAPKIEIFLRDSLPYSIMSFLTVLFLSVPNFFEIRNEKKKQEFIRSQMESVFKEVFPDAKVVDPFEQMKMEYSKAKNTNFASAFLNFYDFSRRISDYVARIEDFSSDGNEVTAELKIKEISYVEKIRESLSEILDDLKVTSTVRSRDGQYFIMRITGNIKSSKQKIKKKEKNEPSSEEVL